MISYFPKFPTGGKFGFQQLFLRRRSGQGGIGRQAKNGMDLGRIDLLGASHAGIYEGFLAATIMHFLRFYGVLSDIEEG